MSRWDDLLAVQDLDTTADQLDHRRRTLPERTELGAAQRELAEVDRRLAELTSQRDVLGRQQQRLEDEITSLQAKAKQSNDALYGGSVTNPRQLEAMQEEIASLQRRVSQLEDQELEVMEQIEPVDAELQDLTENRARLVGRSASLEERIADQEREIDTELADVRGRRESSASSLDPAVLAEYEVLRGRFGGVAVARLVGGVCQGCHLSLSAVEIDRIKHLDPDETVNCEECGRLLVR